MPTVDERALAKLYAQQIETAYNKGGSDRRTKLAARLDESAVKSLNEFDEVEEAIKRIARHLDSQKTTDSTTRRDRDLNESEKARIAAAAGEELGIERATLIRLALKSASNNSFMDMHNYVSELLKELLKQKG